MKTLVSFIGAPDEAFPYRLCGWLNTARLQMFLMLCLLLGTVAPSQALQGQYGIHDPSSIVKYNGVYHVWGTGNQIYHLTSTDLISWSVASPVFASGTWPSWINTYVSGFAGFFWAPECIYMNGRYYMYYSCSTGGRPCAIGVATSTDLVNWTDQGVVVYSTTSSTYGSIDPALFADASGNYWMTFGSHLTGIWLAQINPSTGKRLNSTLYNIAGNGNSSSEHEASYVIRSGSYYYLFYNKGVCCAGTSSTYYVQMGRATSPTGPYYDRNGNALASGGGTTVLSSSGQYIGPGCIGLFQENGYNYLTYHYYDSEQSGAPMLSVGNIGWDASAWPFITQDWIPAGTYQVRNLNSGLVWDAWGCTGASGQAIAQGSYASLTCQQWVFVPLGNGEYRINCVAGGLSADVVNCSAANGALLNLYSYWGGSCQRHRIERASGSNSLVFSSVNGNRVVEVPNASTTAGVQLALYDYNGCTCQKWQILSPTASSVATTETEALSTFTATETMQDFAIYPNPAPAGILQVDLQNITVEAAASIHIVNSLGQIVYRQPVAQQKQFTLQTGLRPGVYVLQLHRQGTVIHKKVVIP